MTSSEEENELLMRYLDGRLDPNDQARVAELLRDDAEARAFLRTVAEQAVVVADVQRIGQHKPQSAKIVAPEFRPWKWAVAAVAAFVLLVAFVIATTPPRHVAKVSTIIGPCQYIGADGKVQDELKAGTELKAGDTIRTRSSRAWVELSLDDGSVITVAGRSRLRLLNVQTRRGFQLAYGSLWATVVQRAGSQPISIQTPTATVEATTAQFDLEAHSLMSIVRVNDGSANVVRLADGQAADVIADYQAVVSLSRRQEFAVVSQPEPVNVWNCSLLAGRGAVFGKILPATAKQKSRLGAKPMLIGKKATIYAANFSVQCSRSAPVMIESSSRVRIRGATQTDNPVYFGITTQRIKGGFFGKYICKIDPESQGQASEPWQVEVDLTHFEPVKGMEHLPDLPTGMELTDIWVVSPDESAQLEIHRVEFLPREVDR